MMKDGVPISSIAAQLRMGKSSLTGLIDRMEASGLVHRKPSDKDARSIEVFLRKEGRALAKRTVQGTRKANAELLAPFSEAERQIIARFLTHVSSEATTIIGSTIIPPSSKRNTK